jgi:NitT/TauT family transport system substrate-binding protein
MKEKVHLPNSIETCVDYAKGLWKLSTPPTDPNWGRQSAEEWQKLVATLQGVGELPANTKPEDFYTNDFVP